MGKILDMTSELSFLLISDIHFGEASFSPDFTLADKPPKHQITNAIPMKNNLIDTLKDSELNLQAILVSGDLTSTGGPAEFCACIETVHEIGERLNINKENIFISFGNHDINWRISKLASEDGYMLDKKYHEVAGRVGHIFIKNMLPKIEEPTPGSGIYERDKFVLYVINSGFYCTHDQNYRHGFLGVEQIKWLEQTLTSYKEDPRWQILLLHHHAFNYAYPTQTEDISCLEEGAELLELIGRSNLDIVCHGHRHHPIHQTMMRNEWCKPVTFLCAGSLSVNEVKRRLGEIPNLFHVVQMRLREKKIGTARGSIKSYRYITSKGWIPVEYSVEVPLEPNQPFGSISTESQQKDEVRRIIDELIKKNQDTNFIDMPNFTSLPHILQCIPSHKLNTLIKDVAFRDYERKVVGNYPDEQIVIRK